MRGRALAGSQPQRCKTEIVELHDRAVPAAPRTVHWAAAGSRRYRCCATSTLIRETYYSVQMRAVLLVLAACGDSGATPPTEAGAAADAPAIDAAVVCPATPPACATATFAQHSGLHAIDPCAFPIQRTAITQTLPLPSVTLADVAADLNRTATRISPSALPGTAPGVALAFQWNSGDESVAYWIPQGITGSFDASATGTVGGRKLLLVSWYYKMELDPGSTVDKGVRIAIADVTDPANITYRFALLVEPTATGYDAVKIHAGGLAWSGDLLYVPVTGSGFRVFDLAHIGKVDGTADALGFDGTHHNAYGYAYAIPQVATFTDTGSCAPVFSFAAIDRTTSTLVTGEYDATSVDGRLYRWSLPDLGPAPVAAYVSAESYLQGAVSLGDTWWLSSSRPAAGHGELVRTQPGAPSTTLGWSDSPEDLAYDPESHGVWSLSESASARYVFLVGLDALR